MTALGKPIAAGRTAEVYAWNQGQVLKLFHGWFPSGGAEYEARIVRAVHAAGLPVPAIGGTVEVNGRLGLIYERVEGPSLFRTFRARPWTLFQTARLLAELHAATHACSVPGLPTQRQRLEHKIRAAGPLPPDVREAALQALGKLPDGDRLCHGDFHPDNIVMTAQGPVIIDWMDATSGNPLADVARTLLLISHGTPESARSVRWLLDMVRRWFRAAYLTRYFQLCPGDRQELTAWRPVVAAARLEEAIVEEEARLLAAARELLKADNTSPQVVRGV